jgi:hypothetical protein
MALFKKIDLVEYRHRLELQQSTLHLSLVFNETERQDVAIIYDELIEICDKAIARNNEKEKPPFQSHSWLDFY